MLYFRPFQWETGPKVRDLEYNTHNHEPPQKVVKGDFNPRGKGSQLTGPTQFQSCH